MKEALKSAYSPPEGPGEYLLEFEKLTLHEGESPRSFMFELKRLLDKAIPGLEAAAREKLLYYHFLSGLPEDINAAIRASPDCTTSEAALTRALALINGRKFRPRVTIAAVDNATPAVTNNAAELAARIACLEQEIMQLRAGHASAEPGAGDAIAAVTPTPRSNQTGAGRHSFTTRSDGARGKPSRGPRCFLCAGYGHIARYCANNNSATSARSQQGSGEQQGNGRGAAGSRGTAGRV